MKAFLRSQGVYTNVNPMDEAVGVEYRIRFWLAPNGQPIDEDQIKASLSATMERAFSEWRENNGVADINDVRHAVVPLGETL